MKKTKMKTAIVLCGGGAKGSYQAGFAQAIRQLKIHYDIVTGTSIGSLNGALLVQQDFDRLNQLWTNLTRDQVIKGEWAENIDILNFDSLLQASNGVKSFFQSYIKEKGADISPFRELIKEYYDPDKFHNSPIDYGLVTVEFPSLKPVLMIKKEMGEKSYDYFLSSCSAFPAFPLHEIDGQNYVDGGYHDNLPIELALKLGAERLIVVDLNTNPTHPEFIGLPNITYIVPSISCGSFLDFSEEQKQRNMRMGYLDTMKAFGLYKGNKYTFIHTETPTVFDRFYLSYLNLMTDIPSLQHFLSKSSKTNTIEDYGYTVLDGLMETLDYAPVELYKLDEVLQKIHEEYQDAVKEDLPLFQIDLLDLSSVTENISHKKLVMLIANQLLEKKEINFFLRQLGKVSPISILMAQMILHIEQM